MITSTTAKLKIEDIKIPENYEKQLPNADKLKARIEHFKKCGTFDREILVDENNTLLDGYTVYLISKMLGIEKVRVLKIKVNCTVEECFVLLRRTMGIEKKVTP